MHKPAQCDIIFSTDSICTDKELGMPYSLTQKLLNLMGRHDNIEPEFEQWRKECEQVLQKMPVAERRKTIQELRTILAANRTLFLEESQAIFDTLVQTPPSPRKQAQAKHYRSVGDL